MIISCLEFKSRMYSAIYYCAMKCLKIVNLIQHDKTIKIQFRFQQELNWTTLMIYIVERGSSI